MKGWRKMTYEELKQDAVDHVREGYKHHPAFFRQWSQKIANFCKAYDKEYDLLNPPEQVETFEDLKNKTERFPAMLHPIDAAFGEFNPTTGAIEIQTFTDKAEAGPVYMMALLTLHDTRDGCTRITDWPESWLRHSKNNFIESFGDKSDFVQAAIDYLEIALAELDTGENETPKTKRSHSEDFTSVIWDGFHFSFTKSQAAAIEPLWDEYEKGTWSLGQETIGDKIGSAMNQYRLIQTFEKGNHPAWGTLIIPGEKKGTFRLADTIQQKPTKKKKTAKKARKN